MGRPNLVESIHIRKEIGNHSSMAFVLVGMNIKMNRSTPIKTTCGGLLCDEQRCSDWNGTPGCGCHNFRDDINNIAFEHMVFFEFGNDFIQHHDLSSNKVSLLHLDQRLPSTVTGNALPMSQEYFDIEAASAKVVKLVNDNNGWTMSNDRWRTAYINTSMNTADILMKSLPASENIYENYICNNKAILKELCIYINYSLRYQLLKNEQKFNIIFFSPYLYKKS